MHPYVKLAKSAVEEYVRHGKVLSLPKELPPEMQKRAAVFVSLKKSGQLRGCIGTVEPREKNICLEIINNAIAACSRDKRFNPVSEDELDEISYSVDVLSEPERISSISELDPKKYGVIVIKGFKKGLLLPDLEGVDSVDEQLRIAKMKAGIDPDDTDVEILRFTVVRYK